MEWTYSSCTRNRCRLTKFLLSFFCSKGAVFEQYRSSHFSFFSFYKKNTYLHTLDEKFTVGACNAVKFSSCQAYRKRIFRAKYCKSRRPYNVSRTQVLVPIKFSRCNVTSPLPNCVFFLFLFSGRHRNRWKDLISQIRGTQFLPSGKR